MNRSFVILSAVFLVFPLARAGVLARYSFDGDLSDSSGNGHHGTLTDGGTAGNSGITTVAGQFKFGTGAMHFDSVDRDFISLPLTTLSTANPWTLAFWAKRSVSDNRWDMVLGQKGSTSHFLALENPSPNLRWRGNGNTASHQADFTVGQDTGWHHYALVSPGNGDLTLYCDGSLVSTDSGNNTTFNISSIGDAYNSTDYSFRGELDEVWILDEALNANSVAALFYSNDPEGEPPPPVTRLRVFFLGGQSNTDGRAVVADLPENLRTPRSDVDFYYKVEGKSPVLTTLRPGVSETSQFGPEILLGHRLANLYETEAGTRVAIIKYANGGTNLHTQWKAGGDNTTTGDGPEYVVFQQTMNEGLAALADAYPEAEIRREAMVWMQGESDADSTPTASAYQANLTAFIADVRATFGETLPFIIGRLSSGQTAINAGRLNIVRSAQEAVAAAHPRTGIVSTDGFGMKSDNLHFDAAGQQALGSAFAVEAAYYVWMTGIFPPGDIEAGLAEPDADRDGDGQTNRQEFLAGTNPLAAASLFKAWFARTSPDGGEISYPGSVGRMYRVETYDEENGAWDTMLPSLRGSGDMVLRTLADSRPRGMYRVCSELP